MRPGNCASLVILFAVTGPLRAAEVPPDLSKKALAVLNTNCHRCHGQAGAVEGGMNYILDREKLLLRKKIVPGQAASRPSTGRSRPGRCRPPASSPDLRRPMLPSSNSGSMPAAPGGGPDLSRSYLTEAAVFDLILADLEKTEKRARRFVRDSSLGAAGQRRGRAG